MTHYIDRTHAARSLGGDMTPNGIVCPGPGHSARDRSLSVMLDPDAPEGFIVHSFSDDDPIQCREHVRSKLGLPEWQPAKSDRMHPLMTKPKIVCHYVYQDEHGENYLRVTRKSDKTFAQSHWEIDGWENGKPKGPPVPYRLPEIIARPDDTIWLVEGEKDADNLAALGLLATTAPGGGAAFPLTLDFGKWFDGRKVIAIADNDPTGARWRDRVSQAVADVTHISMPAPHKDVTDWLTAGGTVEALQDMALYPAEPMTLGQADGVDIVEVTPTPFEWVEPSSIPQRAVIYGNHLYRKFVSMTVSPGGLGKSSMVMVEALAMASNKPLLGDEIFEGPLKVWYWNGEDPQDENTRRLVAAATYHKLNPKDFAQNLWIDSGRAMALKLASMVRGDLDIHDSLFLAIERAIQARKIDVLVLDPFVSVHSVQENDNGAIDAIVKRLGLVADRCNCAIELVHHVRKPGGGSNSRTDIHDARGAGALTAGVRSGRVLNVMSEEEATEAKIASEDRFSYFTVDMGKANLAKRDGRAVWRKLVSVPLDNGSDLRPGDMVGVVDKYEPPKALVADIWPANAAELAQRIAEEDNNLRHWTGNGPAPADWFGFAIARVMGLDEVEHRGAIRVMIKRWINADVLRLVQSTVNRNKVVYVHSVRDKIHDEQTHPSIDDDDSPF